MRAGYACCVLLLAAALPFSALAGDPAGEPATAAEAVAGTDESGMELLRQVSEAYRQQTFRGRLVYVRGNRMDSMQLVHATFDGVEHERLSHLDNSSAEVIRRGQEIIYIHPDARMTRLGTTGGGAPFRQFATLDEGIPQVYELVNAGESRVAGRTADLLKIRPRDRHRYGYRLWVDREHRLPLRYEIVNRKGVPLESVEFVELEAGIRVPEELFRSPPAREGKALAETDNEEAAVPAVKPSWLPPGFRVTGSELQRFGEQAEPVTAVTYSDGLAAFSFFVEKATAGARPAGRQIGPTMVVSGVLDAAGAGRYVVTLVGELPAGTAVRIIESVRHRDAEAASGPAKVPEEGPAP
ncbi:MAG: MucB/RseB C-terminal domain-containing protein [Gammaproteobacteria bacterium]